MAASNFGSVLTVPLPPTRRVSSMPGTKKISCTKPEPSTMLRKLSMRLLPERSGISSRFGPATWMEAGLPARRVHTGVRAGGGEHAERRHADEFPGVNVDGRPRLGDHAGCGSGIDRGE